MEADKALRAKFGAQGRKQRNNAETDAPGETIRRPRIMQHAEPDALVGEPNQADEKQGVVAVMVRAAMAAKAASGVAQAKPRVNTTLAATSKAIQIGRRQPMAMA
jgi:hypothetical protein